jgi:hypothetical protein
MKKSIIISISVAVAALCNGQSDTIVSNNEKIPCTVKEITPDAVKYSFVGEDLINTLYKNVVQKIVFKNGRTQTFSEATAFKKVVDVRDYENVTITQVESEIKGLFKLGDASAKAKGTTTLSNQERVKERAYRKFKIQAAMQGGNSIYLTNQRTTGNLQGGWYQASTSSEASLTGVVYSNELPNYDSFKKLIADKTKFNATYEYTLFSCFSDLTKCAIHKQFTVFTLKNENGLIMIEGKLDGESKYTRFRVVSYSKESFTIFYEDKDAQYNIIIKL